MREWHTECFPTIASKCRKIIVMETTAQLGLLPAEKVAAQVIPQAAANGLRFASWGETRLNDVELERMVGAVPAALVPALERRVYFFVPLVMADGDPLVAPAYTVELGDQAICHRNASFGSTEAVFVSTRMVEDRFGLAFEFFINVAHNFADTAGVPESFSKLVWSQAEAQVRGETSQDSWETRKKAFESRSGGKPVDEKLRNAYYDAAFCDALAMYLLSLAIDYDYHDLRERDYPLLSAPALAERLRHVAALFPANPGFEFQILYRRKN